MTVRLTSPVLGQEVGYAYTGALESWLIAEGYATTAGSVPNAWTADANGVPGAAAPSAPVTATAAVLTAPTDAVDQTAAGTVVFGTKGGVRTTVTLALADTPAEAATKIDTALAGLADAAIVSGNLAVTSAATGPEAYVVVVDGTAAVLADLGLVKGASVHGTDGRSVGTSNTGAQAGPEANSPATRENREAPYWPLTPDLDSTIANDGAHLTEEVHRAPGFDFDDAGADTEAPSNIVIEPNEGVEGDIVRITGRNLEGITAVKFDTVAGTDFVDDDLAEGVLYVTVPAGTAGPADVLLDDGATDTTITGGFTYLA